MLSIEHISKTFNPGTINQKHAIRDLSLELKEGDFVTVIGGNGAGKSTLLNAVAGVWPVPFSSAEPTSPGCRNTSVPASSAAYFRTR